MNTLSIDFETRSTVNLSLTGVYQYAAHPSTDVWCMAYAHGDNTPKIWYVDEPIPESVAEHIHDGGELRAWNAQFERIMWAYVFGPRYGFPTPDLDQWHCTAAEAAAMSLPRALQACAAALGAEAQKDMEGNRVILQMMRPRKIDKDTGAITWWEDDYRMARGGDYCLQDVVVERELAGYVNRLTDRERDLYLLDQTMNDRGVGLDRKLCVAMQGFASEAFDQANEAIRVASNGDIDKVTKVRDITDYLRKRGVDVPNLTAQTVAELQRGGGLAADITRIIDLRAEAGKASVSKIEKMLQVAMDDDRMRGLLMYFGANTGRWAGRLVQPHNFPRPTIKDIEWFIEDVMAGDLGMVDLYAPPLHVVSSMLRSVLVPAPGNRFLAGDFSQIEARVVAWIAGQEDLVGLFRSGGKVYEEMASVIYNVPLDTVTDEQRWTGKQTVLGCGFQMGPKRFVVQCAKYGVTVSPELAAASVTSYRTKYDRIPALWKAVDTAAIEAALNPGVVMPVGSGLVRYVRSGAYLWCILPSGRAMAYAQPRVEDKKTPWGETVPGLTITAVESLSRRWQPRRMYGGLLTENFVQAIARDIMADAMLRLEQAGYPLVLTVHDEIIADVPKDEGTLSEFTDIMSTMPSWAAECPAAVEGWEGTRYRK